MGMGDLSLPGRLSHPSPLPSPSSPGRGPEELLHGGGDGALVLLESVLTALARAADHVLDARPVPVDVPEGVVVAAHVEGHSGCLELLLEVLQPGGGAMLPDRVNGMMAGDDDPCGLAGGQLRGQPRALRRVAAELVAVDTNQSDGVEHDEGHADAPDVLGEFVVERWEGPPRGAAGVVDLGLDWNARVGREGRRGKCEIKNCYI